MQLGSMQAGEEIQPLQDGESAAVRGFVGKGPDFPKRETRPEGRQQVEDRFGTTKNAMKQVKRCELGPGCCSSAPCSDGGKRRCRWLEDGHSILETSRNMTPHQRALESRVAVTMPAPRLTCCATSFKDMTANGAPSAKIVARTRPIGCGRAPT